MRRTVGAITIGIFVALLVAAPAAAQQDAQREEPINLRIPPPPPPPVVVELVELPLTRPDLEYRPDIPDTLVIPGGTRINVVLDTPISTRITSQGDRVSFRTSDALRLTDEIALPPETEIVGRVTEAQKPGGFGRTGVLRVAVERIELPGGAGAPLTARLDTFGADANGRVSADSNKSANLYTLGVWSAQGALIGAQAGRGKGAAIGAGIGAAIAAIILGSRKGTDLYLEPGTPFTVILESDVPLPGETVYDAQRDYMRQQGLSSVYSSRESVSGQRDSAIGRDPDNAELDPSRPKLKRRPPK